MQLRQNESHKLLNLKLICKDGSVIENKQEQWLYNNKTIKVNPQPLCKADTKANTLQQPPVN
jgi:hypothetical protein